TLLKVVAEADDAAENLMLVGHNPSTEMLIHLLTGKQETMPTAAVAEIDLDMKHWTEIRPGTGTVQSVMRPKDADASR
ncbi:MAG: histidine phosphatase family protein, partial [Acidobacteriota bacterium]